MFKGKNVIVTGGSSGIGLAIAHAIAKRGGHPALVARNRTRLVKAQKEILSQNPRCHCEIFPCDVGNAAQVHAAAARIQKRYGTIHGLVNNAGKSHPEYFEKIPAKVFDDLVRVDYLGSVYFTREVYETMPPGSFIAFTSSVVGYLGTFGFTAYAGPKFAQVGFAESLWHEARAREIHVCVLCPPDTKTPGFDEEEKGKPEETRRLSENASLMTPEDVAENFLRQLAKKEFLINVNWQSALFYRLHNWFPGLVRHAMQFLMR